jgi:hypothetical protein
MVEPLFTSEIAARSSGGLADVRCVTASRVVDFRGALGGEVGVTGVNGFSVDGMSKTLCNNYRVLLLAKCRA